MVANVVEPIGGKNLGEAAETVFRQLRYVIDEVGSLKHEENEPMTPEKTKHLRKLLGDLDQIESNTRQLLVTSSVRLNTVKADVKLRLMSQGHPA